MSLSILLSELQEAGMADQVTTLATRVAAHADLSKLWAVAILFHRFHSEQCLNDKFRFGIEVDGTPADPWSWNDLE
jgi:hypothetical protein